MRIDNSVAQSLARMSHHVCKYYINIMNAIDTGCPMRDYCEKDVYLVLALRNM